MIQIITKRSGSTEIYNSEKIKKAVSKSFLALNRTLENDEADKLIVRIEKLIEICLSKKADPTLSVEEIQDMVEQALMEAGYYSEAKSYILYRESRRIRRVEREALAAFFPGFPELSDVLKDCENEFKDERYNLGLLYRKFLSFHKEDKPLDERIELLVRAAIELTNKDATLWEMIAGRIYNAHFKAKLQRFLDQEDINNFYEKLAKLTEMGLYGPQIWETYSNEEILEASTWIDDSRDNLLNYSGLDLLLKRYVIRTKKHQPVETIQEMFLGIALFLAIPEKKENRLYWAKRIYDILSKLQVTMATPTLANARKPYHQLSSCFIDTVPDDLTGIYRSISNFAAVSKFGGGMGLYFGKVRASGSDIRGFEGAAGGVIRWIKLANDTAVAVDQLGVRQGAAAVYLDCWHRDLPEFLGLRTNNGDDRMKAHDVFPAVCYPDYFWEQVDTNINGDWYLMCPHEIEKIKGYALEDFYGEAWKERYLDCIHDNRLNKRVIAIKDLLRLIIKSSVETGTPFAFFRDAVNNMNPNPHKGMIYCSNLCTEIAQNMSGVQSVSEEILEVNGETIVVTTTKPGSYVVCNLASLNLGRIDVNDAIEIQEVTRSVMRALDNVIEMNLFPVPYAKVNNALYRPVGLGVSGYHHMLAKNKIVWESETHLEFVDKVFEEINFATLQASHEMALEKGSYPYFEGSDFQTGDYFQKRSYHSERWQELSNSIQKNGIRNGYLLAIAPTASTSIIAGTTAGIDPIMDRFFYDEKKSGLIPRVAPDLSDETYWFYKNAHLIDQNWSVKACGIRGRHIDQAQSMNLYITDEHSFRDILNLYLGAWKEGVKTVYYIRSKSLEIEECESCSA